MNAPVPTVVVAGTASGVGKTSVATGLMAALRAAGHVVQGSKVGPDYIDPSYHSIATGRPARNLDVWLSGADLIAPLARHGATGADITVVEGVMGLFDGKSPTELTASTAHVARLLGAPVLLVVDAGAMARSAAAIVHGFATFDPGTRLAGVVLNRVGSPGHADLLRQAIEPTGVEVVGVLPRMDDLATPSRHLGLVPADERRADAHRTVAALGEWVGAHLDLDAVMRLARTADVPDVPAWSPAPTDRVHGPPVGVAIAGGPAFSFRYTENLELLEAAGATLLPFDPMHDASLPVGTDVVYLGGGFPEVHADALADNTAMLAEIRAHAAAGRPVVGECGGLLYLCHDLDGTRQADVLPVTATMDARLTLGYRRAIAASDSILWRRGEVVTAHEFHRTVTDPPAGADPVGTEGDATPGVAWRVEDRDEGFVTASIHASYLHTHWAAYPQAATRLVAAARTTDHPPTSPTSLESP
ncbi:cobyrinate a,c-diamide synthase [Euzebya rosea]|uniref:cobyrinate a,c-diamide synthase n=1 Tax=Euzebya rosea TaxID=2052804 RepID=UPI000D3EC090|nr:cobyrinate a,c-diamide synthase [Euzebya rosea]